MPDPKKIFVVHGRHEELRRSLFTFLRSLGLEPMEWEQVAAMAGSTAPYIGEVLDVAFQEAQAVIVLLTPDDEVRLAPHLWREAESSNETEHQLQSRANVIFEAGLALGRSPDRTIIVQIGKVKIFSDIVGRHLVHLSDDPSARHTLANRLRNAGCPVDVAGSDWLHAGRFVLPSVQSAGETAAAYNEVASPATKQPNPDEIDILRHFARADEQGVKLTVIHVQGLLRVSAARAEYHLENLEESGYLGSSWNVAGEPTRYFLTREGRRFLVANDLVS
ncbi:MAG: nucleotide-binding protein [Longimicrobiaceae bacterium]